MFCLRNIYLLTSKHRCFSGWEIYIFSHKLQNIICWTFGECRIVYYLCDMKKSNLIYCRKNHLESAGGGGRREVGMALFPAIALCQPRWCENTNPIISYLKYSVFTIYGNALGCPMCVPRWVVRRLFSDGYKGGGCPITCPIFRDTFKFCVYDKN